MSILNVLCWIAPYWMKYWKSVFISSGVTVVGNYLGTSVFSVVTVQLISPHPAGYYSTVDI